MKRIALITALIFFGPLKLFAAEGNPSGVSPDQAVEKLLEGNRRFVEGKLINGPKPFERDEELRKKQRPFATILSCSDSRVPPETIFDQGRGDIFIVRVAGNTIDDLALGSLEYGVTQLGANLLMVLGHEKCGAVDATLAGKPLPGHIDDIAKLIAPAMASKPSCEEKDNLDCAVRGNVNWLMGKIPQSSPLLAPLVKSGKLKVVGAYYDLDSGKVELLP